MLERIRQLDQSGPSLHAVSSTNPDALQLAGELDAKRTKARSPLHGIPVLLKDNFDAGDRMLTTAGSLASPTRRRRATPAWSSGCARSAR